jgi:hypothetical protein
VGCVAGFEWTICSKEHDFSHLWSPRRYRVGRNASTMKIFSTLSGSPNEAGFDPDDLSRGYLHYFYHQWARWPRELTMDHSPRVHLPCSSARRESSGSFMIINTTSVDCVARRGSSRSFGRTLLLTSVGWVAAQGGNRSLVVINIPFLWVAWSIIFF